jgi:hypothetical protein
VLGLAQTLVSGHVEAAGGHQVQFDASSLAHKWHLPVQ